VGFRHIRPLRANPRGMETKGAAKAARYSQSRVPYQGRFTYMLLGAASRRFRGADVAKAPHARRLQTGLALAGDGDVFAAAITGAFLVSGLRNRAGNLVGIDAPVGGGLGKIP
jgi:hypothetical protein